MANDWKSYHASVLQNPLKAAIFEELRPKIHGVSSGGFSLRGLVLARPKTRWLKPALLNATSLLVAETGSNALPCQR